MHTNPMKLHWFFVKEQLPEKGRVKINDTDLLHQWRNVLRFQVGHRVVLLDNSGSVFYGQVLSLTNREANVEIINVENEKNTPKINLNLFMSLSKRDSFEMVLEKGTELGVNSFIPVLSDRSEKKSLNMERTEKIIKEAGEQSERTRLPEVLLPISFDEMIGKMAGNPSILSCSLDPRGEKADFLKLTEGYKEINIAIGPEGGWSEREFIIFGEKKIPVYSLGSQILKSETAAIAAAAIFLLQG